VFAVVVMMAAAVAATARETPLAVGERAPAIELRDQHGKSFRLADALAANRFVVVAFYVKAFTGG
jgi:peroxiredoxin